MSNSSRRAFLVHGCQSVAAVGVLSKVGFSWALDDPHKSMIAKGAEFLKARQAEDGSWSGERKEPGITGLVLAGLLKSKSVTPNDPVVTKGLAYLEKYAGAKGGLSEAPHANYTTAIALLAFHEANKDGRYDAFIKGSQNFLTTMQWDEGEGKNPSDTFYGGAGYGGKNDRPDLSNTSFMLEALRDTGIPGDDPAMKKAIVFLSRCQNLKSEFNDQPWAGKVNDGGFIYTPANNGTSVAGKTADGGLRSYASMTYAGLKSMIYAGLSKDDPRVKAATDYLKHNYTVEENPGLGQSGLFYYYHTFAKTMDVLGSDAFVDAGGASHDWRADLTAALLKRQNENGSWANKTDRFMEGDPNLVTAYGLLCLSYLNAKS